MAFRHGCVERLVPLVIVAVLGAVAVPQFLELQRQGRARGCLEHLANGTVGAACPATGRPYPAGDVVRCPDPGGHLPTDPRYAGGRFEQTFPPDAGGPEFPIAGLHRKARIESTASGVVLTVEPRAWWKYAAGPALQVLGLWALVAIARGLLRLRRGAGIPTALGVGAALLAALVLVPTALVTMSVWSRQVLSVDAARRELRVETYVAGVSLWGPAVHSSPKALAPAGTRGDVVLVGSDGRPVTVLRIDPKRAGALAPIHATLFSGGGRP